MVTRKMLSTHGLILAGTAKEREKAIAEIQQGFSSVQVACMHQSSDAVIELIQSFLDKLPDAENIEKPCFAIFCEDAKKLFQKDAKYEGYVIEDALQKALVKGIRVYFAAPKLSDFPDYVQDEFETKIDLSQTDEEGNAAVETKKKTKEVSAKSSKSKSSTNKTLERTANSALTSVTRSVSTNIVNSIAGGKQKSIKDIAAQATTTALSTFLRNMIKEATKTRK